MAVVNWLKIGYTAKYGKNFVALPIYTHITNLKGLTKIIFKLLRWKGNLCGSGSGGMTILNPFIWGYNSQ